MSPSARLGLITCSLCLLLPVVAPATPYWDDAEAARHQGQPAAPLPLPPAAPGRTDYLVVLGRVADFLRVWQVSTPGVDFGGIREGEHLPNIIQTDNTSEAIWVWSQYYALTGDDQYHQNVLDAFTYSLAHPAYLEEGGSQPTTGYYRMYNCGWAVRAEQKYRDLYGDATYKSYGDSCASYIRYHTLIRAGTDFYRYVNPPILSWALGNLHDAGVHEGNAAWMLHAESEAATTVKAWIEGEPALLENETWAMSGGATMWGILHSYFRGHPDEIASWLGLYAGSLAAASSPGDFENAWNGWYAYGHRAVGLALDDAGHLDTHVALTEALIAEDGDLDGGIPARPPDTDAMDQTWVANYLATFGLNELLSPPMAVGTAGVRKLPVCSLSPNPSAGAVEIRLALEAATDLDLSIFDAGGRRVERIARGPFPAGIHTARWSGTGASGVYWIRIGTPLGAVSRRIVITR